MRKAIFLLLLVLSACSIEERGAPANDPDTDVTVGGEPERDSVIVTISAPRYALVGDEVPITIVVQNNRQRNIDLHLTGRDVAFDIVVARADSTVVWQRLRNVTIQQIVQLKTLAPRESFILSDHWKATEAGQFMITAELPTDAQPLQAQPVTLQIR